MYPYGELPPVWRTESIRIVSNGMGAAMIDTLRTTRRLTDAGLEQRQAEALAIVLHDLRGPSCATKADLSLMVSELTASLEKTKVHLIAAQLLVSIGLLLALKFVH
jgi:hypothetical protein